MLQRVVDAMIGCARAEVSGDDAACNGLPMRVCHVVAETAEGDLLPHMVPLARVLGAQCAAALSSGEDMAESVALEALGVLTATLLDLWDDQGAGGADEDADPAEAAAAAGKARKDKAKKEVTAFKFGQDKAGLMKEVTRALAAELLPLAGRLWGSCDDAAFVAASGSSAVAKAVEIAGPAAYLDGAASLLRLVLFHGCGAAWGQDQRAQLRQVTKSFLRAMTSWTGEGCELDYGEEVPFL